MLSLQQEVRDYLKRQQADFSDNTRSFKDLDFTISSHGDPIFQLEVKEKRKPYNAFALADDSSRGRSVHPG